MKKIGIIIMLFFPIATNAASQISINSNISFGLIEFASNHQGELTLGSNGGVSLSGSGLFYQGGAVPGLVTITGDSGIVEIRCSSSSTLGGQSTGSLEITDIEASVGSGAAPGGGTPCEGVSSSDSSVAIIDLGSTPNPRIYFGGKLNIPPGGITGSQTYGTDNNSGAPLSINAVFQ